MVERVAASSTAILFCLVRSIRDMSSVCMPFAFPVSRLERICCSWPFRIRERIPASPLRISMAATRPLPSSVLTSVWQTIPWMVAASCARTCSFEPSGNESMIRDMVSAADWVWRVPNTRWPVSAAVIAMLIVSGSRISPTRIMSGSCRSARFSASGKFLVSAPISRWFMMHPLFSWTNSMGSSIVRMWSFRFLFAASMIAARVVDFPDPVGPVTSTSPRGRFANSASPSGIPSCCSDLISLGITRITLPVFPLCCMTFTRNRDFPGIEYAKSSSWVRENSACCSSVITENSSCLIFAEDSLLYPLIGSISPLFLLIGGMPWVRWRSDEPESIRVRSRSLRVISPVVAVVWRTSVVL